MTRTHWILISLLAVQVLLLALVGPWSGTSSAGAAQTLLPALAELAPAKVRIDEDPDTSLVLERAGDAWTLPAAGGYPVDGGKMDDLMESLEGLRVRRPVVSSDRYHEALKVTEDDNERRLRVWGEGSDDPEVDLFLGTSPNYRVSHVRLGGDDRVYEVQGLGAHDLSAQASGWIDTTMVDAVFDDILSVSLRNDLGTLALIRGDDGDWTVAGDSPGGPGLDGAAVDSWVRSLANLRIAEPAGAAANETYGLGDPSAILTLVSHPASLGDEKPVEQSITVLVGAPAPSDDAEPGQRYATVEGSTHAAILSKWDAEKLTTKTLNDLLTKPDD